MHGHDVVIYDTKSKAGGLNEYGIAAYKSPDNFAQAEVDFVLSIGGVTVETGKALGRDLSLAELRRSFDAVFLAIGLGGVNALNIADENSSGVENAVDYIADLRQAGDLSRLPVGRRIVVVGGGMTAIDIASQFNAMPKRLIRNGGGSVVAVEFEYTAERDGRLTGTGETFTVDADVVFKAIGQTLIPTGLNGMAEPIELQSGRIKVDAERRTSAKGVWAGGDCVYGGEDLTVAAVQDGKVAAESIHRALSA
jgi:glutamate synthase (NADPH/NADH) small chain